MNKHYQKRIRYTLYISYLGKKLKFIGNENLTPLKIKRQPYYLYQFMTSSFSTKNKNKIVSYIIFHLNSSTSTVILVFRVIVCYSDNLLLLYRVCAKIIISPSSRLWKYRSAWTRKFGKGTSGIGWRKRKISNEDKSIRNKPKSVKIEKSKKEESVPKRKAEKRKLPEEKYDSSRISKSKITKEQDDIYFYFQVKAQLCLWLIVFEKIC